MYILSLGYRLNLSSYVGFNAGDLTADCRDLTFTAFTLTLETPCCESVNAKESHSRDMYSVWGVSRDTSNRRPTMRRCCCCCFLAFQSLVSLLLLVASLLCVVELAEDAPALNYTEVPIQSEQPPLLWWIWNAEWLSCTDYRELHLSPAAFLSLLGCDQSTVRRRSLFFRNVYLSRRAKRTWAHSDTDIFFSIHLFMHPLGASHRVPIPSVSSGSTLGSPPSRSCAQAPTHSPPPQLVPFQHKGAVAP